MLLQVVEVSTDAAAVFISIAAFAVSMATLIFQFFYQRWEAIVRLLQADLSEDEKTVRLSYLVSNSGNRDLVLINVSLAGGDSDKAGEITRPLECKCEAAPATLKPQEAKLINVEVGGEDLKENPSYKKLFIVFEIVTSAGKHRSFPHEITHIDDKARAPHHDYSILYRIANFYETNEKEV